MMVTVLQPETTQHADLVPKAKLEHVLTDQQTYVLMLIQHNPSRVLMRALLCPNVLLTPQKEEKNRQSYFDILQLKCQDIVERHITI